MVYCSAINRRSLLILALLMGVLSSFGADSGRIVLPGHRPDVVARLTPVRDLPATNQLSLAIGLPLRNRDGLKELLRQLYDPHSTNFHQFLAPAEFAARFGPTEDQYRAVRRFVESQGLTVAGTHPNRLVMNVRGPAGRVGTAFGVALRVYHHPVERRDFFAPDAEPSLDLTVPILHISGLNNYSLPRPRFVATPLVDGQSAAPNAGSASMRSLHARVKRNSEHR